MFKKLLNKLFPSNVNKNIKFLSIQEEPKAKVKMIFGPTLEGDESVVIVAGRSIIYANNYIKPKTTTKSGNFELEILNSTFMFKWKSVSALTKKSLLKADNFSSKRLNLIITESELTKSELDSLKAFFDRVTEMNKNLWVYAHEVIIERLKTLSNETL